MAREQVTSRWTAAWPDVLAFVLGLGVAWAAGWTARDLVWSLWLSSLVVGYAMIVWSIVRPGVDLALAVRKDREFAARVIAESKGAAVVGAGVLIAGGLFAIAFFTVHFGGFHYVHSQFLHGFFPLDGSSSGAWDPDYAEVVRRYWHFLPAAFLAERAGFMRPAPAVKDDLSVTVEAIARRKAANAEKSTRMMAPYRNVMRMHFLIFFFAFAHFAHVDHFAVYATVYGVYFFPWRLVKNGVRSQESGIRGVQG